MLLLAWSLPGIFCLEACNCQTLPGRQNGNHTDSRERSTAMNTSALSSDTAIEVACKSVGLIHLNGAKVTARQIQLTGQFMPFLHGDLRGKSSWRIEFSNIDLAKTTGRASLGNRYVKHLVVVLAPNTGQVLCVTSTWPDGVERIPPYPSVQEEERQLRARDVTYTRLPAKEPQVTLLEAIGSKDMAFWSKDVKQIHACYINESTIKYADRPVWAIQLRGFPPFVPPVPPGADPSSISENQRNHIRNVVDAESGEWLGAGTVPQPVEGEERLGPIEDRFEERSHEGKRAK